MKKRSLFAAVAMLIVSALVLTSATYAWFAQSQKAEVKGIGATVSGVDGSLLLVATSDLATATDTTPKTTLQASDWSNLPTTLTPVSFSFGSTYSATATPTIYKVNYDGSMFTGTSKDDTEYVAFSFKVQYNGASTVAKDILLKPTLPTKQSEFSYVLVRVKPYGASGFTNYIYAKTDGDNYIPVTSITGTLLDDHAAGEGHGTKGIVDGALIDTAVTTGAVATFGGQVTANNTTLSSGITVIAANSPANTNLEAEVQVYIWAEGNDTNCTGSASALGTVVHFDVEPAE